MLFVAAWLTIPAHAQQEDLSVFGYWRIYDGDPATSFYKHLYQRAARQLGEREKAIEKLKTKSDWQQRQLLLQKKMTAALGPFPPKTPLNPVVTGRLDRQDFTVEKLYFESQPGYYVNAALFIPKNKPGKLPAIVYTCGHTDIAFRGEVYQRVIINLVKKGFVVLTFDPVGQGERKDYQDVPGKISGTREHSYAGAQLFLSGVSPASYFAWDGIRAVDYLISRPEVDASRIGITGRSGGGTQATYIAALDDRVRVAALECYITTFDKLLKSRGPQDAEQNLFHGIANGLDLPDFIEIRAPKPTLLIGTTNDIFSIQGFRDAYHEARRAYQAFGQPENLQKVEDDAEHASTRKNREATYTFFQKHLDNPGSGEDQEVDFFSAAELDIIPEKDSANFAKRETLFSLNTKYTTGLLQKRKEHQKGKPLTLKGLRESVIAHSGYETPPAEREVIFSGRILRPGDAIEKYLVKGAGEYYLPVLHLKPKNSNGKSVLWLDGRGKAAALAPGETADQLANEGYDIIAADLSGIGELATGYFQLGDGIINGVPLNLWFAGILTDKSLVAVRAEEIGILADFVKTTAESARVLTAVASGTLTADLLHAAVIDNPFKKMILLDPLVSYRSLIEERIYDPKYMMSAVAGALSDYDLPDLVGALSTQNLLLLNPVDPTGKKISQEKIDVIYGDALRRNAAGQPIIRPDVKPQEVSSAILEWLGK
ncbi:alpha/beta hydrolase [Persicitalea sp.]|uniref:alpha/beta hydrolase n=1 Tax=Persicitalea sp. TaxID=3100273 RepID=UPI00359469E1